MDITILQNREPSNKATKEDSPNKSCELPMPNQLGRYVSINVKKSIAEYADTRHGQRRKSVETANSSLSALGDIADDGLFRRNQLKLQ